MRLRAFAGVVLFATLALGGNCRLDLSPSGPVNRLIAPGQTVRVQGLRVGFLEVVADTRCPANVMCPVAGDAIAAFELRVDAASTEVELHVVDPVRRSVRFQDYIVELTALAPYPIAGQPIDHDDYRATINVRRD
jgi:hypothetical protein